MTRRAPFRLLFASLAIASLGTATAPADAPRSAKAGSYPFRITPSEALARLQTLGAPAPAADELKLFARAAAGQPFDDQTFADACLLASGVLDPAKRQDYRARLDRITEDARQATADAKTAAQKGEVLLKFLHAGPMAKGYESKQTTLSGVLDTGHYNCVSSAVLYNLVGRRLGLELRAVEIPRHVFSVLIADGRRTDVETTNPQGFNPHGKRERPDGVGYDPAKDKKDRREVGDLGLAAIVYYNRGVGLSEAKQPLDALRASLSALGLDPANPSAAHNAVAEYVNWGNELGKQNKYEEALKVIALGLELAPDESGLKNNRKVTWAQYAAAEAKAGRDAGAVAVLRRAAAAVPDGDFVREQAHVFMKLGEDAAKAGRWAEALAAAERGLKVVDAGPAKELTRWRTGLSVRWSEAERKNGDVAAAAAVLAKALAASPNDRELHNGVAYLAQESLKDLDAAKGPAAAAAALAAIRQQFPGIKDLGEIARSHVSRSLQKPLKEARYADALTDLARYAPLLDGAKDARELGAMVYDTWAQSLTKKKDYPGALRVYADALTAYPKDARLTNNAVVAYDRWAKTAMDAKNWDEAIRIYQLGLKQFPGDSHLSHNLKYCQSKKK